MTRFRGNRQLLMELAPALASVSCVRRAVRDAAADWRLPADVGANAALVVSELATNAVLHARTTFVVTARPHGPNGIRLEVTDASGEPVHMPLPPPPLASGVLEEPEELNAIREALVDTGTTGRGLSLVAELSDGWGVNRGHSGKTVWAELAAPEASGQVDGLTPEVEEDDALRRAADPATDAGARVVRIIAVPVRLVVESDRHFDDLMRELQVMALDPSGAERLPARDINALAEEADLLLGQLHHAGREATRTALARGDRLLDIDLACPPTTELGFQRLDAMLRRVAVASRAGWLLTGLPSREVNAFRRWYRAEVKAQLAGRPPRPCPFPTVREHEPGGSEPTGDISPDVLAPRHEQLVALRAALSNAQGTPEVADALVRAAIGSLERSRGMVCLLEPDRRTVAVVAACRFPDEIVRAWRTFSLFADLPASECIRTLRIITLPTRAERDRRFPLISARPIAEDPAVVCVPLRGPEGAIGCLALSFREARAFSDSQLSFLQDLADAAAERLPAVPRWSSVTREARDAPRS